MARIIVVDDSRLVREIVRRSLVEAGHEVLPVDPTSLFDVFSLIREFLPKVVITDFRMPGCEAESLVRMIREDPIMSGVKILALSAHHDASIVQRMLERGVDGYLFKDGINTLLNRVEDLIRGTGSTGESSQ
jgi:DNA-binding response OmpR family regulator